MKSIAAQAIVGALTLSQMLLAGTLIGVIVFILGISGLIRVVNEWIPMSVVRGIQLGVGLSLGVKGLKMVKDGTGGWVGTQGGSGWDPDCYLVAALAFVAVIAVEGPAGGGRKGGDGRGAMKKEDGEGTDAREGARLPLATGSDRVEEEEEERMESGTRERGSGGGRNENDDDHGESNNSDDDSNNDEDSNNDDDCGCSSGSGQRCGCCGAILVSGLVPTALLLFIAGLGLGLGARAAGGGGGW